MRIISLCVPTLNDERELEGTERAGTLPKLAGWTLYFDLLVLEYFFKLFLLLWLLIANLKL